MKKTTIINLVIAGAASLASSVSAATYSFESSNLSDVSSDIAIVDNTGAIAVGTGTAALGYFRTISDPMSASLSSLGTDFEILASNSFDTSGIGFSVEGFFNVTGSITDAELNPAVTNGAGKQLFLFIANSNDIATAGQIALLNSGQTVISDFTGSPPFEATVAPFAGATTVVPGVGTLLSGTPTNVDFFGSPTATTGQLQLALVPEPSSLALLGLGGVALVFRRRK